MTTTIRHWLPILTFCPVNDLPDLVYITVEFRDTFVELYEARKKIRKAVNGKKMFMEDIAKLVADKYPQSCRVQVRLAFDRHVVTILQGDSDVRS